MMDLYNVNFHPDFSIAKLDEMAAIYRPLMEGYFERWEGGRRTISQYFDPHINRARSFLYDVRPLMTYTYLPTYFAHMGITANNLFDVTLSASAPNASITINTVTPSLASGSWTGRYHAPLGVTVTANVPGGYRFSGWTIKGDGTAQSPNELTTAVDFGGNIQVQANFVPN